MRCALVSALFLPLGGLRSLPLLPSYLAAKREIARRKPPDSAPGAACGALRLPRARGFGPALLEYLIDQKPRRAAVFAAHTAMLDEAQGFKHLNNIANRFINDALDAYSLYFFELEGALYLAHELPRRLDAFMALFQRKILETYRISTLSVLEAAPTSRFKVLINSIRFRLMAEKLGHLCRMFNHAHKFDDLNAAIKAIADERLSGIAMWAVLHSEAVRKGLEVVAKTLIIAALNNIFVPLLLNYLSGTIAKFFPGYPSVQSLLKCLRISFN